MQAYLPILYPAMLCFVALASCEQAKAPGPAPGFIATQTDSALYAQATADPATFVWYQSNPARLRSASTSGHSPYQRTRYNAIAAAALTDGGKLPRGGSFPDGSLIVKELFNNPSGTGTFELLAVMKKESNNPNAAKGWLWAEYLPAISSNYIKLDGKGAACTGCHADGADRDYTRLFETP